ncbi:MAG: cytochrome c biogenesis protein CcdA, partial [Oscillospiraceae bacterium]
ILMLLSYSLGLGIPFIASALTIDKLKSVFGFIKRNYKVVNIICGSFLILVGILMMTGLLSKAIAVLS